MNFSLWKEINSGGRLAGTLTTVIGSSRDVKFGQTSEKCCRMSVKFEESWGTQSMWRRRRFLQANPICWYWEASITKFVPACFTSNSSRVVILSKGANTSKNWVVPEVGDSCLKKNFRKDPFHREFAAVTSNAHCWNISRRGRRGPPALTPHVVIDSSSKRVVPICSRAIWTRDALAAMEREVSVFKPTKESIVMDGSCGRKSMARLVKWFKEAIHCRISLSIACPSIPRLSERRFSNCVIGRSNGAVIEGVPTTLRLFRPGVSPLSMDRRASALLLSWDTSAKSILSMEGERRRNGSTIRSSSR